MSRIVPQTLELMWPQILGQLGRERFCQDLSRLSGKELDLIHQFANLGDGEFASQHFTGKFQREYFARLVEKGLLIRTKRGRYRLYHHCHSAASPTGRTPFPLNPFPFATSVIYSNPLSLGVQTNGEWT
jgi:hypothetical protein